MKLIFKILFILFFISISVLDASVYIVSNVNQFNSVLPSLQPGDTILLSNGIWQNSKIVFSAIGTADKPIVLKAETPGEVVFSGTSSIRIYGQYLIIDGLIFKDGYSESGDVIEFRNGSGKESSNCRLTNCAIIDFNPADKNKNYKWVSLYGSHNRVDHCYFRGKTNLGATLVVWLSSQPNYHRIDSNYFGYRPDLGENGGETIRIGTSDWSMYNSCTAVEFNYFEECNGEIEIISNKSCENAYRYNTFVSCQGTLTLRHGNRCFVEGNYFFANKVPNSGGIRIIGEDHVVINNYIADCAGTGLKSAISIMNGVPNSPLNRYFQVKRAIVAFNTLVNNRVNFNIGAGKDSELTLPPLDCVIANNIVQGNLSPLILETDKPINMKYEGNIFYGAEVGINPIPQGIVVSNPKLHLSSDSMYRPLSDSPIIGNAVGNYPMVERDIDGQMRGDIKDIGCDQLSGDPIVYRPLKRNDVGPNWMKVVSKVNEQKFNHFRIEPNYPNPFNSQTTIKIVINKPEYVQLNVHNILGQIVGKLFQDRLDVGTHCITFNATGLPTGIYYCSLNSNNIKVIQPMMLIK